MQIHFYLNKGFVFGITFKANYLKCSFLKCTRVFDELILTFDELL